MKLTSQSQRRVHLSNPPNTLQTIVLIANQSQLCYPLEVQLNCGWIMRCQLLLTTYRMLFKGLTLISLPYGHLKEVDLLRDSLRVTTKAGLQYIVTTSSSLPNLHQLLLRGIAGLPFCQATTLAIENSHEYDFFAQLQRMRLNPIFYQVTDNDKGTLCSNYPRYILIPKDVDDGLLQQCRKAYTKGRVPALTYYFGKRNGLWRAGKVKLNYKGDSRLLMYINCICSLIQSFDFTQSASCGALFLSLSVLQTTLQKMVQSYAANMNVLKYAEKWLKQALTIIEVAYSVAKKIQQGSTLLLIEGADCDRVSQVSALTQVILDPFFRTKHGLALLIEKQFVSFGYPFGIRLGFHREKNKEAAPTFIQFLECLHQLINAYPSSFQYTPSYLARIGYETNSTKYNDFLFNDCHEKYASKQHQKTFTIWRHLPIQANYYNVAYYAHHTSQNNTLLQLRKCPSIHQFVLWTEYFDLITQMKQEKQPSFSQHLETVQFIAQTLQREKL